jgi:hypothetical protein
MRCSLKEHTAFIFGFEEKYKQARRQMALLGLVFKPEDVGNMFLRNVRGIQPGYTALRPRKE